MSLAADGLPQEGIEAVGLCKLREECVVPRTLVAVTVVIAYENGLRLDFVIQYCLQKRLGLKLRLLHGEVKHHGGINPRAVKEFQLVVKVVDEPEGLGFLPEYNAGVGPHGEDHGGAAPLGGFTLHAFEKVLMAKMNTIEKAHGEHRAGRVPMVKISANFHDATLLE